MPTAFPGHGRAENRSAAWSDDHASQSFLHIGLQYSIESKLRLLRAAKRSLGVPLRCRGAIFQAAASGGGVAPQLSGDRRCCPPETASDFLHGVALRAKEADLLPLHKREIPSGQRLCRQCKHRWWHAACSETILFLPPAALQPRPQQTHSPCLLRSLPRTAAAYLVLPRVVNLVTIMVLAQIDPNTAFECSSHPLSRCCDDHLNPPNTPRRSIAR
jgi:hypothetical protein